jgi:Zn-dependent peptidase ImmA (M78 family)
MLIDTEKTKVCFRKVKNIKEHRKIMCIQGDRIPVSVMDLLWVVGDMYALNIDAREVVFEAQSLRSLVERYKDNSAKIFVKSNLEVVVKRFSTVKELMHLAIDEPEDWSPEGVNTLSELFIEMQLNGTSETVAANPAQSEVLAEIAAIEVLYPFEFRDKDKTELAAGATSLSKLSLYYHLPTYVISKALSPWYHNIASQMWHELNIV